MLSITYHVSVSLQKSNIDLSSAMEHIELVQSVLNDMRLDVENEFKILYASAQEISSNLGVLPTMPRIVGTQSHRQNYSTNSPEVYFRISFFIPYFEELNSSLSRRFSKHKNIVDCLQNIIPIHAIKSKYEEIVHAVQFYHTDFGSTYNNSTIEGKWILWVKKGKLSVMSNEKIPKSALDALKVCQPDLFPNIYITHIIKNVMCLTNNYCIS